MVNKYKAKEKRIILFLTFSALSISAAVTSVSLLAREIVNMAMDENGSWRNAIILGSIFVIAII